MLDRLLHLLPAPVHRLACRMGYCLRKAYLKIRRGSVSGCSIIARDSDGRLLLVRHSYGPKVWSFPGGGLRKGEDPAVAAAREFSEELGCGLENLLYLGQAEAGFYGAINVAHVFTGLLKADQPIPDGREIIEARFFASDDLPSDCSGSVLRNGALYEKAINEGLI